MITQVTSADSGYNSIHNVFYADGFLYEADSRTKVVKVFDVSDPNNAFFVRNITTAANPFVHDVTVVGSRLYASGWNGGTFVYDVSDVGVNAPLLLGSVASGGNSHSSWVTSDGQTLIVAREAGGADVQIFDISVPNSAVLLSTLTAASLGISGFSPHNPVLFSESTVTTTPSRCSSDPQGRSGCGGTLSPRLHSSLGELGQRSADPAVPQTRSRALEDISQNAPPPR